MNRSEARKLEWQDPKIRAKRLRESGWTHSKKTRIAIGKRNKIILKGRHISPHTEFKKGNIAWSKLNREKMPRGENHSAWKGGITPINFAIRNSLEYKLWRQAVFERDKYTCIWGGKEHGSKLHADHIKPFALFPELRFAIDNGRTLCVECHRKTDTFAGKGGKRR